MKELWKERETLDKKAKKYGVDVLGKKLCFAWKDLETCLILKDKDCYECSFYKTRDQLDVKNKELLGF